MEKHGTTSLLIQPKCDDVEAQKRMCLDSIYYPDESISFGLLKRWRLGLFYIQFLLQ